MRSRWIMLLLAGVLGLALLTGCGSSEDEGGSGSDDAGSSKAESTPSPEEDEGSAAGTDALCAGLTQDGGPADAFGVIPVYDLAQAKDAAESQRDLMKGIVPPAEIAKDWVAWRGFLALTVRVTSREGATTMALAPVAAAQDKLEAGRKRLEDYAFATCG